MSLVKLLIDSGADVNIKDNDGKTPLDHAQSETTRYNLEESTEVRKLLTGS